MLNSIFDCHRVKRLFFKDLQIISMIPVGIVASDREQSGIEKYKASKSIALANITQVHGKAGNDRSTPSHLWRSILLQLPSNMKYNDHRNIITHKRARIKLDRIPFLIQSYCTNSFLKPMHAVRYRYNLLLRCSIVL